MAKEIYGWVILGLSIVLFIFSFVNFCPSCDMGCAWYDLFCQANQVQCSVENAGCYAKQTTVHAVLFICSIPTFIVGLVKILRGGINAKKSNS